MRGIFVHDLVIVIIEPLTNAQHYFPNITELLESMYHYQLQRKINFYENYGHNQYI